MRVFFVSTFVGTFLPASIGGDAVRSYGVTKLNVGKAEAVASVLMDRILGVASVLVMGLIGLSIAGSLNRRPTCRDCARDRRDRVLGGGAPGVQPCRRSLRFEARLVGCPEALFARPASAGCSPCGGTPRTPPSF